MQPYLQGIITGGIFVFSFLVLSASNDPEPTCDINLSLIKKNTKQIETIWGAIETTMDLQELHHNQYLQTNNIANSDIDTLKKKVNDLITIIENYY